MSTTLCSPKGWQEVASLGPVPKTSSWLPVSMPPLPRVALWHIVPLKTAIVTGLLACLFQIPGSTKGLFSWGVAGAWRKPGSSEMECQHQHRNAACVCKLEATPMDVSLSPQLWKERPKKSPTIIPKLTGLLPCVVTGLSHRWVSKGWHSWKMTSISFPYKIKP